MRPARARRRRGFWLDLFACFLIPAYTMLFAGSVEWLGTNFSVIAVTGKDHYWGFVYWGALAGGYFAVMLTKLALILPRLWQRSAVCLLALLACLALGYALAIPYLPDDFPGFASLHVVLAAGACVLLMLALLLVLLSLYRDSPENYRLLLVRWGLIVGGSGLLFLLAGMVSSALEVFFTITAALLTRRIWLDSWGTTGEILETFNSFPMIFLLPLRYDGPVQRVCPVKALGKRSVSAMDKKRLYRTEGPFKMVAACAAESRNILTSIPPWSGWAGRRSPVHAVFGGLILYVIAAVVIPTKSNVYPGC